MKFRKITASILVVILIVNLFSFSLVSAASNSGKTTSPKVVSSTVETIEDYTFSSFYYDDGTR